MEWQQLKGFAALARRGSFTAAAQDTLRTQSAVSQQVKALEEELGCPLVERLGRGRSRLTPAGRRLAAFCATLEEESRRLREDLGDLTGRPWGRLTLAAPFTTLYHLLPDLLAAYGRRYPQVELTLLDRPQAEVLGLVGRGEVELGAALASRVPAGLEARPWRRVVPRLLVAKGHPLAGQDRVALAQAAAYPLILPPPGGVDSPRGRLERLLAAQGLTPRVAMESSNVELSALYVRRGLGIAFATVVPDLDLPAGQGVVRLELAEDLGSDHLAWVWRRGRRLPAYVEGFLDLALEGAAE